MSSTEIALRSDTGVELFHNEHVRMTSVGLQLSETATVDELLAVAEGLGVITDAACFGVGDLANFYKRVDPASYREWIERPSPVKGLDNKTVKVYAAVCAFYPHEQRARHMASYEGHRGLSFSYFSRVRRYGPELAEYWLAQAAENNWSLKELEERIEGGTAGSDDVPDVPEAPTSQRGQFYWLGPPEDPGRHLLYCGDSTDLPAMTAGMQAIGKADMMWTDPPYGVEYVGKTEDALTIDNDGAEDLPDLLDRAWVAASVVLKESAGIYIAGPTGDNASAFIDSIRKAGWIYKQMLVWVKNTIVLGRQDYQLQHEGIYYGTTAGPPSGRRPGGQDIGWYGGDNQPSVFFVDKPPASREHPTMKPVKLIMPAIEARSQPGDIVFDPFGGSGSTLIAADQTGRRCFLVEYGPGYADVIQRRYAEYLEKRAQGLVEAAQTVEAEAVEVAATMPEE